MMQQNTANQYQLATNIFDSFKAIVFLFFRLWVAQRLCYAGLDNFHTWESMVTQLCSQWHVDCVFAHLLVFISTSFYLISPAFLVLGLGTRIIIMIFLIFNTLYMLFPHSLWLLSGHSTIGHHLEWYTCTALLFFYGPGKISLDNLLKIKTFKNTQKSNQAFKN